MMVSVRKILTACAALAVLCAPSGASALPDSNTIEFSNCMLALPGTTFTASAQCGFLEVPENPADPEGRKIPIHVAVAGATSTDVEPDPVFFFAGGPGLGGRLTRAVRDLDAIIERLERRGRR